MIYIGDFEAVQNTRSRVLSGLTILGLRLEVFKPNNTLPLVFENSTYRTVIVSIYYQTQKTVNTWKLQECWFCVLANHNKVQDTQANLKTAN